MNPAARSGGRCFFGWLNKNSVSVSVSTLVDMFNLCRARFVPPTKKNADLTAIKDDLGSDCDDNILQCDSDFGHITEDCDSDLGHIRLRSH